MRTKLLLVLPAFMISSGLFSQKDYIFASTGQQKLLLNPAFAAGSAGVDVQTLYATDPQSYTRSAYTGISYRYKNFGYGLSNTYYKTNDYYSYSSNQTDLSLSYKINLSSKVTLIPAIQASYLHRQSAFANYELSYLAAHPGLLPEWDDYSFRPVKNAASFSSGFIMDVNKTLTFGMSFYDMNQPDVGLLGSSVKKVSWVSHASLALFKDKKINFQPYTVLKFQAYVQNYAEIGAYTTYKFISLHTAFRTFDSGTSSFLAGVSFNYKKVRLGYTYNTGYNMSEVFLSANLFNKNHGAQRLLMLN